MKNKLKRFSKRSVSIVLSLLLVVSTLTFGNIGSITASAAGTVCIRGVGVKASSSATTSDWTNVSFTQDGTTGNWFTSAYVAAKGNSFGIENSDGKWRFGSAFSSVNDGSLQTSSSGSNMTFNYNPGQYTFGFNSTQKILWAWEPGTNFVIRADSIKATQSSSSEIGWENGIKLHSVTVSGTTEFQTPVYIPGNDTYAFDIYDNTKGKQLRWSGYDNVSSRTISANETKNYLIYNTSSSPKIQNMSGYKLLHLNPNRNTVWLTDLSDTTEYTITKKKTVGSTTSDGSYTVKAGNAALSTSVAGTTLTITPGLNEGKVATSVVVKNSSNATVASTSNENGVSSLDFVMPASNVTVTVTYAQGEVEPLGITKETPNEYGTYTVTDENDDEIDEATPGDIVTITANPNANYKPTFTVTNDSTGSTVTTTSVTGNSNAVTFEMPASPVTVSVTFSEEPKWYIVGRFAANGHSTDWSISTQDFKMTPTSTAGLYKYETNATLSELANNPSTQFGNQIGFKKRENNASDITTVKPYGYSADTQKITNSTYRVSSNDTEHVFTLSPSTSTSNNGGGLNNGIQIPTDEATDNSHYVTFYLDTTQSSPRFWFELDDIPEVEGSFSYLKNHPADSNHRRIFVRYAGDVWSKGTPYLYVFTKNTTNSQLWGWNSSPAMIPVTNTPSNYSDLYYYDVDVSNGKSFDTVVLRQQTEQNGGQQTVDLNIGSSGSVLLIVRSTTTYKSQLCDIDWHQINLSNISSDGSDLKVIAKNGTIRHTVNHVNANDHSKDVYEVYDKFSKMATTSVTRTAADGTAISGTDYINSMTFEAGAQVMYAPAGTQLTISTTFNTSALSSTYKVEGFVINGESYTDVTETTSNGVSTYSIDYTVGENGTNSTEQYRNGYVEITPVYFYKIGSHVEFFVNPLSGSSSVVSNWSTVSAYAWYQNCSDTAAYNSNTKHALGGYPGQPMLKKGGRYYIQVPKTTNSKAVLGVTMNNYIRDDIHALTFGHTSSSARRTYNYQTYDFDDFASMSHYKNAETIVAELKIKNTDNFNNATGNYFNFDADKSGVENRTVSSTYTSTNVNFDTIPHNTWEVLTDVNGLPVDIYDNYLNESNTTIDGTTFSNETEVTDYADETDNNDNVVRIISDGYRNDAWYIGGYGTMWYVYKGNKYLGALPSSAFLYNVEKDQTLNTMPADFLNYSATATVNANSSKRTAFWNTFKAIYNEGVFGKPTLISYEETKAGSNDWGTRSDVRWYFFTPTPLEAHVRIQYGTQAQFESDQLTTDSFISNSAVGTNSSVKAAFTNNETGYVLKDKTDIVKADNVLSSASKYFNFEVDKTSFTYNNEYYVFRGWYLQVTNSDSTHTYYNINSGKNIYSSAGSYVMLDDAVFVAKYVKVDPTEMLSVSHKLLSADSTSTKPVVHNGTGTPRLTVTLVTPEKGRVNLADNSTDEYLFESIKEYYQLYSAAEAEDQSSYYLEIKLSTDVTGQNTVQGVYRKNSADYYRSGLYPSTEDSTSSCSKASTNDPLGVSPTLNGYVTYKYLFSDLYSSNALKTNSLNYFTDVKKPIDLTFKYYDRLTESGSTTSIKSEASTLTYTIDDVTDSADIKAAIIGKFNTPDANGFSISMLNNVLDTYNVWFSQNDAVNNIGNQVCYTLKYENEVVVGTEPTTYSEKYSNQTENFKYHTNYLGVPQSSGDNWVTYKDVTGEPISVTGSADYTGGGKQDTFTDGDINKISSITVWAFNTPKEYTIKMHADTITKNDKGNTVFGGTKLKATPVQGEYKTENGTTTDTRLYTFVTDNATLRKGLYNQRVGTYDAKSGDKNKSNLANDYLKAYFGFDENYSDEGNSGISFTGEVIDAPEIAYVDGSQTEYYFDGWYVIADDGSYVKFSSDKEYGNRITGDLDLYAMYKTTEPPAESSIGGVSITKNGIHNDDESVDIYFDDGDDTLKVRLNTQLNVYYDGQTIDGDPDIEQVAVIYVDLDESYVESETVTDTNGEKTVTYTIDSEAIKAWLEDNKSYLNHRGTSSVSRIKGYIDVDSDGTRDDYIIIDSALVDSTGANGISLTSKNRVQFVLPMSESVYVNDYPNMIVYAAVNSDGTWIVSDNYVSFVHSEVKTPLALFVPQAIDPSAQETEIQSAEENA